MTLAIKLTADGRAYTVEGVDIIIVATGLKQDYSIYRNLTPARLDEDNPAAFERPVELPSDPSDSSPYAVVPCKKAKGAAIYFIGPGAGDFYQKSETGALKAQLLEPFGISENAVRGASSAQQPCDCS